MEIFINGETKEIPSSINLAELLKFLALPQERVAVELNKKVVRKKDWQDTKIADADKIEVIHFVGGG